MVTPLRFCRIMVLKTKHFHYQEGNGVTVAVKSAPA
jgi:hypothetical protein